ncbi:hypothetical protein LY90DRAFT_520958 [Neocallimastix californiae]|uniref:Ski2 N-terminal domain-containing protein n=1 Tax=Neocallimastix californiae TaxID=1754190 RepID=A0A1Y1XXF1_9FUNG|nr:hypothetical protein LY90DRAFT_520958 [Neocallimastix californiae]|eukprot:ORX90423.1 hypothetical protein LY90DRAFT_520958 [Neocallimastix californiae]
MSELLSQLSQAEQIVGKENLNDENVPFEIYRLGQSNITFIPNNLKQKNKNVNNIEFDKLNSKLKQFDISIDENQSAENYSNSKIHSTSNLPLDIGPFNYEDNIKTIESKYLKVKNTFSQKDLNEYQHENLTAQNSLSINRAPYKSKNYEYVTGKSENVPFMPGGFTINDLLKDNNIMNSESAELEVDRNNKSVEKITSFDIENILEDNDDLESMDELKALVENINNKENNDDQDTESNIQETEEEIENDNNEEYGDEINQFISKPEDVK